jgi:hypothetical protein
MFREKTFRQVSQVTASSDMKQVERFDVDEMMKSRERLEVHRRG